MQKLIGVSGLGVQDAAATSKPLGSFFQHETHHMTHSLRIHQDVPKTHGCMKPTCGGLGQLYSELPGLVQPCRR